MSPLHLVWSLALVSLAACAGDRRSSRPTGPSTPAPHRLVAGNLTTCLLLEGGEVRCLGPTPDLPHGTAEEMLAHAAEYAKPHALSVPPGTVELALGDDSYPCTRDAAGLVACWRHDRHAFVPVELPESALQISAGGSRACAVLASGGVACWGGGAANDAEPGATRVPGIDDATYVATGFMHACALRRTGRVACWGDNQAGQLGDGGDESRSAARDVIDLTDVVALSSRHLHTCALRRNGEARCWGLGDSGQLGPPSGTGPEGTSSRPLRVPLDDLDAISAANAHTCGLRRGAVYCWGHNSVGQLGTGPVHTRSSSESNPPARVPGIADVVELAAGAGHQCALRSNGHVMCWGNGALGQTGGNGLTPTRALP